MLYVIKTLGLSETDVGVVLSAAATPVLFVGIPLAAALVLVLSKFITMRELPGAGSIETVEV